MDSGIHNYQFQSYYKLSAPLLYDDRTKPIKF